MKKVILSVFCALISVSAFAQGTISASNTGDRGKISYDTGGLAGTEARAQFYQDGNAIGPVINILGAGTFVAGTLDLGIASGAATLTLGAWSTENPALVGFSDPFSVTLGGEGNPPTLPGNVPSGFSGVVIPTVPEPSTIALAVLGGAALLFRRRK